MGDAKVFRRFAVPFLLSTLAIPRMAADGPQPVQPSQVNAQAQPLSDEEIRARAKILVANQHADDEALELYQRVERHVDRTGGGSPRTIADKVYRVVPTGAGSQKLLLQEEGKPVDSESYARQMQILVDLLKTMANPDDPKTRAANAKYEKRQRERAQFVEAANDAYISKWVGREVRDGHDCDVIQLDPNPKFQPRSMFQDALAHTKAKIWVDHAAIQIVHGEASVTSDVSFGGGILGKLYRGSVVSIDQAEVASGIWLPARYQYDYAGRKFLFSFDLHQLIEVSRYRRIGTPKEALQVVQAELSSGQGFRGDP